MKTNPLEPHSLEITIRAPDQLGQALKRTRTYAKLSQVALAETAGVRQATISKTEKGLGSTEVQTVFSLCAALGLEIVLRPRSPASDPFRPEDFQA